ncbi:sulfite reductase subunit alpha [Tsukamurella ocularis]|uniref:sulfite reductase subunit alpha n=1 Tax=Tsukamurella ocularis TaxID=1970234 RepID=UPI002169854E|nr:sulfite reductase subunit alpha [Tsukamurella ocularis]MCS3780516.1 sulfite reductase (NADPH) flavoprotein alpha-component [Tsukamurella ocularis]MCS3785929.1 sulfite reductase (NADPH) flavoprotein alpha-component [Tsukamurella ocularis]MCS3849293.1 sulfite reductase (NADPH) flavoprotein alpha-component [Tsukamurella ocularis]
MSAPTYVLPEADSSALIDVFTGDQRAWLSGFLAGLAAVQAEQAVTATAATLHATVLYGTQTGNSEELAERLVGLLRENGLGADLAALDDADPDRLAAASHLLVVTSTYGEGEMPDNAELFWEALSADAAPRLEHLQFSVLALGDSGYEGFCRAGQIIDTRLEQLGAARLAPRVDCDVDFEEPASAWLAEVVSRLRAVADHLDPADAAAVPVAAAPATPSKPKSRWNKKNPFPSRLVENRLLSGAGSAKEIRHLEFDLADSSIEYAAGDALNVMPRNAPALVDAVLAALDTVPDTDIDGAPLVARLTTDWEISTPSKDLLKTLAERAPLSELAAVLAREERETLDAWLWGRDVLDLLHACEGAHIEAAELPDLLRPLQPRAYSISSSPLASPDRIHLTVAAVRHGAEAGREHQGVCSTFLADRCTEADTAGISLQPNAAFRVPSDPDRPMIMVGPGTGIAPFRAFLHERAASSATGRNWLLFGDQHRASDFIYADELAGFTESGVLHRLDLAFSRDQAEKIYVQTRMIEAASELYAWLEDGGHFYVCGDASRMAKDVDRALREVIAGQRGRGADDADEYVATLKREKRYVRDVY